MRKRVAVLGNQTRRMRKRSRPSCYSSLMRNYAAHTLMPGRISSDGSWLPHGTDDAREEDELEHAYRARASQWPWDCSPEKDRSKREIVRCIKHYVARQLCRRLKTDHAATHTA